MTKSKKVFSDLDIYFIPWSSVLLETTRACIMNDKRRKTFVDVLVHRDKLVKKLSDRRSEDEQKTYDRIMELYGTANKIFIKDDEEFMNEFTKQS